MCLSMRSLKVPTLGALALCSACFNPEPPDEAASDDVTDASTGEIDPTDAPETVGPEPGSSSGGPGDSESSGDEVPLSACGDGVVQGGEECDLGEDNRDEGACTASCTIAICGDGEVHEGAEVCDDGDESALCDADCTVPVCGDGVTNPLAFEQCDGDDEVLNGSCVSCVAVCDPGWSRCGGGPAAPCDAVIDSRVSCEACGHLWRSELLPASTHVSVDSQWGAMPMVPMIQSARWDTNIVTGWIGFDLEDAGTPIHVELARLELHVTSSGGAPMLDVAADLEHGWDPDQLTPGTVVAADYSPLMGGMDVVNLNMGELNLGLAHEGWINLGLVPRGPMGSWADFEGSDMPDLAPVLRLEGCF